MAGYLIGNDRIIGEEENLNYYPHHIGDFIKDTANLTDAQCMAYLRICWKYYSDESPLEDDIEGIAFAVRSDEKTVSLIMRHYFTLSEGRWHHKRIDEEIAAYRAKGEKARGSANARWNNANAMRTHIERNANETKNDANHKPITNNQEKEQLLPPAAQKAEYPTEFEEAWDAYPPRSGASKTKAFKAWKATVAKRVDPAVILRGVMAYADYVKAKGTEDQFIKQPATFFGPDEHYLADWTPQQPRASPAKPEKFNPTAYVNRKSKGSANERIIDIDEHGEPVQQVVR